MLLALNEDQRDCLQEVANVATGQATSSLANMLDEFVEMDVPTIDIVSSSSQIESILDKKNNKVSAITNNAFNSERLSGNTILFFTGLTDEVLEKIHLNTVSDANNSQCLEKILQSLSKTLCSRFVDTFYEQLELTCVQAQPVIIADNKSQDTHESMDRILNWEQSIAVSVNYIVESHAFSCRMLLLFPDENIEKIKSILNLLLDDE